MINNIDHKESISNNHDCIYIYIYMFMFIYILTNQKKVIKLDGEDIKLYLSKINSHKKNGKSRCEIMSYI